MEGAGKLIEDDELREAMREKGLGTPATRAQIIEGLILEKYVHARGRELQPDREGVLADDAVARPGYSGTLFAGAAPRNGNSSLRRWSTASSSAKQFMREIVKMTPAHRRSGEELRERHHPRRLRDAVSVRCPKCGGEVHENYKKFQCQSLRFRHVEDRRRPPVRCCRGRGAALDREVGPLEGFRSKLGRPFAAKLKLNDANEVSVRLRRRLGRRQRRRGAGFHAARNRSGPCPKCGMRCSSCPRHYVCEKAVGPEKTCDFRSGRVILQRPVERAQMQKLLGDRQDRSAAIRLVAHAPPVCRVPGAAGRRQDRLRVSGQGWRQGPRRPRRAQRPRCGCSARIPRTSGRSSCMRGRYGPYVKHGAVNATLPDKDGMDALTLEDAVALLAAKSGKSSQARRPRCPVAEGDQRCVAESGRHQVSEGGHGPKSAKPTKATAVKSPKAVRKKVARERATRHRKRADVRLRSASVAVHAAHGPRTA